MRIDRSLYKGINEVSIRVEWLHVKSIIARNMPLFVYAAPEPQCREVHDFHQREETKAHEETQQATSISCIQTIM